ncbi:hypothetical protein V8F06_007309 [Rhypophila decipiens]
MATNIPNTISTKAGECLDTLQKWARHEADGPRLARADEAVLLFRIWATNNFVFTKNRICLDWRLRNVLFLSCAIEDLLDELVDTVLHIILNPSSQHVSHGDEETLIASSSLLRDEDADGGEDDEEIDDPFSTVEDIQRQLFDICRAIHRSGILSRLSKLSFQLKPLPENAESLEPFGTDFLSPLLDRRFKNAKVPIRQCLVDTIILRRRNFLYLHQRNERDSEPAGEEEEGTEHKPRPRLPTLREDNEDTGSRENQPETALMRIPETDYPQNAWTESRFGATTVN